MKLRLHLKWNIYIQTRAQRTMTKGPTEHNLKLKQTIDQSLYS